MLTLVGEVVAVKRVPAGSGVSYGYSYRTGTETVLALVGARVRGRRAAARVESGERLDRRARPARSSAGSRWISSSSSAATTCREVGADAVLFGGRRGHPSAIDWAELTARTPLELTAGLGPRIARTYG